MRYKPRKRTALDGKVWWCVFDEETEKWSSIVMFGKYKTKKSCQFVIDQWNYITTGATHEWLATMK